MADFTPTKKQLTDVMPTAEQRGRLRKLRALKDLISRCSVSVAGMAVVGALALIFIYLFSEVAPLLRSSNFTLDDTYPSPGSQVDDPAVYLALDRYEEVGASFNRSGEVNFFNLQARQVIGRYQIPVPDDAQFSALAAGQSDQGLLAYGFDNGAVTLLKHEYGLSYPTDQRLISPLLTYPLGERAIPFDSQGKGLTALALQETKHGIYIAATTSDNRILLGVYPSPSQAHLLNQGERQLTEQVYLLPALPDEGVAQHILLDKEGMHLVIADEKEYLHYYNITNPAQSFLSSSTPTERGQVSAMDFLVGTSSFIIGNNTGAISQWFILRDSDNVYGLVRAREFDSLPGAVTQLEAEHARKGFLATDDQGNLGLYYGTSGRSLASGSVSKKPISALAVSPVNQTALALDSHQQLIQVSLDNPHPDISFASLWQKVWYEGREKPEYVWQASSGHDDFEAKMSFVPLTLGTLKAAFFAMLFAIPLGVLGAIYTAYFMTPRLRGLVKPSIEIMEALPTVILGFLAGLWLAPFLENHLPAVFSILLLMPLMMLAVGFSWSRLPLAVRGRIPDGWEAALLIIPVLLTGWLCVVLSPSLEILFFDDSMRQWLTDSGVAYDQRNALVVGIAMGFAVIPTVFSIAEDAVFNVPGHLTQGALALGATRWQTVAKVVLPTASVGIFSAVMMGFGRAVGETMIVLMATGNSPLVNFNIFEGMRTLSANIAVELPEAALHSTHFRTLFLAALTLFVLTFCVNTLAELVRQNLRKRYSNL